MAAEALLSLALPSSSAERPSMSRRLTSLPSVGADDLAAGIDGQHHLGLGVVPVRGGVQAGVKARAHSRHGRRLGEDFGVRANADFQVLAPDALLDQHLLRAPWPRLEPGFRRDRSSPTSAVISLRMVTAAAGLPRAFSSMTRSSIEMAKVTPAALMACRSTGASSQGLRRVAAVGRGVGEQLGEAADAFPGSLAQGSRRISLSRTGRARLGRWP